MHFVKNLTWYDPWECSRKNLERQDFETWFSILDQGVIRLAFSHANVDQRRVSKGKENKEKKKKKEKKSGVTVTLQRESIEHGEISRVQRL